MINPIPMTEYILEGSLDMIRRIIERILIWMSSCKDSCTVLMDPPQLDQYCSICVSMHGRYKGCRIIIELSIKKWIKTSMTPGLISKPVICLSVYLNIGAEWMKRS